MAKLLLCFFVGSLLTVGLWLIIGKFFVEESDKTVRKTDKEKSDV